MQKAERGRRLFLAMATVSMILSSVVTLLNIILNGQVERLGSGIISISIQGILLYKIHNGKKWARNILSMLAFFGLISILVICVDGPVKEKNLLINLIMGCMLVLYSWIVYVLALSPSFNEYFKSQNV
ncbi:hypothetical protein [Clostridium saccharobutylicum]|uniref:Uncharacterized protein n=2 Tax=Clostridium saccharobutylicum TaxID=169679 RepID=U5MSN2_CLOSA|nr:hypothetical protein [Clostridium saccharobutylicum]AGX43518.1 hypothetical protein CLSA_c25450 [Clostridium saccharobutylicum DSM 13864]AQR90813.1 hypothetical protein CLOSC_25340 [Clostridium saccharobutylicum]AQS00717.1 hypothetical protein CSACC_25410 [Clostridium saccharobutylicum]AQS10376.1 hypothetical protein CLOBY_25190 [Clostridium saccharobutylicum]AQS14700.1 hypothetical protein CLOSACC_25410 [Clostridium saccharobutylicum]